MLPKVKITLTPVLILANFLFIFYFLFFIFDIAPVRAAISNASRVIPFQGTLTGSSGFYVPDGNFSMTFAIYSAASGGTALWSETQTVTVSNGAFSVYIGAGDANGVNLAMDTPPYYLGVKVSTNAEMSPRILMGFSPFAMTAKSTDSGIPAGMISFFNLTACPSGWTDLTATYGGRYIVAKPTGGTLAGTAGTALTNLENRAVGQHNHAITDPGHTHTVIGGGGGSGGGSTFEDDMNPMTRTTSSNGTGITIQNSGSVAGTNAPYIQLLACSKD